MVKNLDVVATYYVEGKVLGSASMVLRYDPEKVEPLAVGRSEGALDVSEITGRQLQVVGVVTTMDKDASFQGSLIVFGQNEAPVATWSFFLPIGKCISGAVFFEYRKKLEIHITARS